MLKEKILENENIKPNTKDMENLKLNFPQFFDKNGEFLVDRFKEMLKQNDVKFNKEGYELNFLGKSYAKYLSSTKTETFIAPHVEENLKEENKNSENLYIIGDNIDALKHLLGTYSGKIKCIYIDPPYNTGSDGFVYPDDFKFDSEKLTEMLGIDEEEAERIINLKGKSSHSAWLTFMYPRLILARELLSDDGVIFISIDDNEQANLKLMCDEIFGENNYLGDIIWNSTKSVTNTALISVSHTYTLVYFKLKNYFIENRHEFKLPDDGEDFENPDNDPRGPWKADPFQVGGWRPNQQYEIVNPKTGVIYRPNPNCSWKNDYEKYNELVKDNRIIFGKTGDGGPLRKRFLWEAKERGKVAKTIWDDVETTTNGTQTLKKLFKNMTLFDNPKSVGFIKKILQLGSSKEGSIVLDFFSGSATTAHAVMQLNAEDGGNRKYILVQLPEKIKEDKPAYKEGYKTIDEIGRERIRRAAKKIKEETGANIDYGFKTYSIETPTNEILTRLEEFSNDSKLLVDDMVEIYDTENCIGKDAILSTFLVSDGYGLSRVAEEYKLDKYICNKIDKSI